MKKQIDFIISEEEFNYADISVIPSYLAVPEWYKNIPPKNEKLGPIGRSQTTVKRCLPYYDALTTGYMLVTSYEIEVKNVEDKKLLYTTVDIPQTPVELDPPFRSEGMPVPEHHRPWVWRIAAGYAPSTPPGYSSLITHPFNRYDLPFTVITGVIDTDRLLGTLSVNLYVKDSFEGVIPKGTPLAQVMPFLRVDWDHKVIPYNKDLFKKSRWKLTSTIYRAYQNNFWVKKVYR